MENIKIFCYGKMQTMNKEEALKKYAKLLVLSEGSEKERYSKIFSDAFHGKKLCIDDEEEYALYMKGEKNGKN